MNALLTAVASLRLEREEKSSLCPNTRQLLRRPSLPDSAGEMLSYHFTSP